MNPRDREAKALEAADGILRKLREPISGTVEEMAREERAEIAQALLGFAEKSEHKAEVCAKAYREIAERWEEAEKEAHASGYAEARDDAAKLCDEERAKHSFKYGHRAGLAHQADLLGQSIRALLPKGVKDV